LAALARSWTHAGRRLSCRHGVFFAASIGYVAACDRLMK
jgi:hypothetical protein